MGILWLSCYHLISVWGFIAINNGYAMLHFNHLSLAPGPLILLVQDTDKSYSVPRNAPKT